MTKALIKLQDMEEFINHNLRIGYLTQDMNIQQLLDFIKNVRDNYIPMIEDIEVLEESIKRQF